MSIIPNQLLSQFDSIYVESVDDTVKIWNSMIDENCAFSVEFIVEFSGDTITIIEHDTTTEKTTCHCLFDLCVSISGIDSGNYIVNVYRKHSGEYWPPDSLDFIGTTKFTYPQPSISGLRLQYYQSGCYYTDLISSNLTIPDKYYTLDSFPNPFNDRTKIEMHIPIRSIVTLKLYEITGRSLDIILSRQFSPGKHIYNLDSSNLSSGMYFITLETENIVRASKKIMLIR
jgi:hypothetical protein